MIGRQIGFGTLQISPKRLQWGIVCWQCKVVSGRLFCANPESVRADAQAWEEELLKLRCFRARVEFGSPGAKALAVDHGP